MDLADRNDKFRDCLGKLELDLIHESQRTTPLLEVYAWYEIVYRG
jgi:hypothetical protein